MEPKRPLARYAADWRGLQANFDKTNTLARSHWASAAKELVALEIQAGWLAILMHAWEWPIPGCSPLGKNYYIGLMNDRDRLKTGDDPAGLGGVAALKWHFTCRMIRKHREERISAGLPDQSEDLDTWPACVLRANVIGDDGHFHASRARAFSQVCGIMAEECDDFELPQTRPVTELWVRADDASRRSGLDANTIRLQAQRKHWHTEKAGRMHCYRIEDLESTWRGRNFRVDPDKKSGAHRRTSAKGK